MTRSRSLRGLPLRRRKRLVPKRKLFTSISVPENILTVYSHSVKEMHELLAEGVEFPDLGMVNIERDHPITGVDSLTARLNEQHPSNWDISPSPKQVS